MLSFYLLHNSILLTNSMLLFSILSDYELNTYFCKVQLFHIIFVAVGIFYFKIKAFIKILKLS